MAVKTRAQLKTDNTTTFGNGKNTRGNDEVTFNDDQLDSIAFNAELVISVTTSQLTTLIGSSGLILTARYNITNALGNTAIIQVTAATTSTLNPNALNLTSGKFGRYNRTSDYFIPADNIYTTAPTANSDNTKGYVAGDIWINAATGFEYRATSVGTGAAIWSIVFINETGKFQTIGTATDTTGIGVVQILGGSASGDRVVQIGGGAGTSNTGNDVNQFGTGAGTSNTGNDVNQFGNQAGNGNVVPEVNQFGKNAGLNNAGANVNQFGTNAGDGNSGPNANQLGTQAGKNNTGENANQFGPQAGQDNTGNNVNQFGKNAGRSNTKSGGQFFGEDAGWDGSAGYTGTDNVFAISNNSIPQFTDAAAAAAAITVPNGYVTGTTYIYCDSTLGTIGYIRL
jgi:hypothetical protein